MKLSIIIPTHNEEEYLPKLLESIKNQNFQDDYEVIVADASSTDRTREIAESYNSRVVEGGLPALGRNRGAEASSGEYLLFLDSDVILTEGYLESALEEFMENDLGIAITQMIPLSDSRIDKISHDFANFFMRSVESIKPHGAGCYGILTRRDLHDAVGGFDEAIDFGEDTDYIEKIAKISSFKVLRRPKLLVSIRRLEKEGRKAIAFKYAKSTIYQFSGRKITAEELDYDFDYSNEKELTERTTGKKRIIYSLCGEGMGHAIRSGVVIKHLSKKYDVVVFASDRAYQYISKKHDKVYEIGGFNTVYEDNKVSNSKTFVKGMKGLPSDLKNNLRLMHGVVKEFKPHVIVSDFEFYANLLSKIVKIPLISLDNISVLTQCELDVPKKYRSDRLKAEGVAYSFITLPKKYLITSFFRAPLKNPEKAVMFSPILREEILNLKPEIGEHILVYQTSTSNLKLLELLKRVGVTCIVYGFNEDKKDGNLQFKKFNEDEFYTDLASCRAILTNGGFTLITEALYLKKPVLSVPVKKQFEQILNALYIERLGYGEFHEELDREILMNFLENLDKYRKELEESYKPAGNQEILEELERTIEKYALDFD
ncbi:MJ1255/VC2487 family glycosyltransferase [Methanobacterium aggregans]|uniref:MJ1255/VC2487 family glycosyltransferase n=1 Tax=Methanobacterium aggregans TaxID=1615586 RepID=UPI00320C7E72